MKVNVGRKVSTVIFRDQVKANRNYTNVIWLGNQQLNDYFRTVGEASDLIGCTTAQCVYSCSEFVSSLPKIGAV